MENSQPLRTRSTKLGRKPKSPDAARTPTTLRTLESHRQRLFERAAQYNVPFSDYVAYVLCRAHGWDIPEYLRALDQQVRNEPVDFQEELPLAI